MLAQVADYIERSEDNLWESVLSFITESNFDLTRGRHPYPEPSHQPLPFYF